jgi:hypothetical protein
MHKALGSSPSTEKNKNKKKARTQSKKATHETEENTYKLGVK